MARLLKLQLPEIYGSPPSPPTTAWSTLAFALSTPPATPSIAYPPIFLSPSSDAFTPSPSPFPAVSPSPHRSLSKASVVGVSVAAVVTLAVVSAVLSTAAGKVGASCLLTPALTVLSSLFSKSESIATGTLQGVVKGDFGAQYSTQALISKGMSKFAASEMKKHESIIEAVNEIVSEDFAASESYKKQGTDIIDEVVRGDQCIISTRANNILSKYAATELKKHEFMMNEVVRVNDAMSRYAATESKKHDFITNEVFEAYQRPPTSTSERMITYAATDQSKKQNLTPAGGLMEAELQKSLQDKGGIGINEREIETKGSRDDGAGKSSASAGAPGSKNKMQETTGNAPPTAMEHVSLANNYKARRNPANLGHVSLSCEISTHRLRFFAFCNSGGTYGSTPPS